MKYLLALILVSILVVLPMTAEANSIYLQVVPGAEFNQGHHFKVNIDAWAQIPSTDTTSYVLSNMVGTLDNYWTSEGTIIYENGIWAYWWNSGPFAFSCESGGEVWFGGRGCIKALTNFSLTQDQELQFQLDFYPGSPGEWVGWVEDEQLNYTELALYTTSNDFFNGIAFQKVLVYSTGINPRYLMDTVFLHPMGWSAGPYTNWYDYTSATVQVITSSPNDAGVCANNIYGIIPTFDPHVWLAGSLENYTGQAICSGTIWNQR